jgi:phosphate uptake regulator
MKLGPATMVISLPSKWFKTTNLKPGDEINVEQENSSLVITTDGKGSVVREIIDLSKYDKLMKRILVSRYLKGNDEIEVIFDTLDKSRIIQRRVDELIGVEIIDQGKDRIIIKDMASAGEDNFENIIKRVLYLLNTLSDESLKTIQEKNTDLEYTSDIEKNINKFTDYCFRILNKKGHSDHKKTAVLYCALFLIEEIADEYKKLNKYITENNMQLNKEFISIYQNINSYNKEMQKLFLKFNFDQAVQIAVERDKIIKEINKQLENSKIKNSEIIILKHFETITEHIIKIMGQLLNIN